MLRASIVFFVLALVAALFGFGGIAASAVAIAKLLFWGFLLMTVVLFVLSLVRP